METTTLLLIFLIALIWYDSMQARECSLDIARRSCAEMGVKLLDETIAITSLGLRRDPLGRLRIRRIYEFRILTTHLTIQHCTIVLVGKRMESMLLNTNDQLH